MDIFSGGSHWINEGWRMEGLFLCPYSSLSWELLSPTTSHPPPQCPPYTFTLPHTATEWLLLCSLTQTFPQKRGRKPFTPFYLLSSDPPPPLPAPSEVVLGQKRVTRLTFSLLFLLPAFPPPNFTQPHTHTDTNIGAHTNWTHPVNSCTWGDKLGSLSA